MINKEKLATNKTKTKKIQNYLGIFRRVGLRPSKHKEARLCQEIALALRNACLDGKKIVWFHVPNESNGGARFGRSLNAIGRIAGAPDYVLITEGSTLLVEVKTDTGKLSQNQRMFSAWCEDCGVKYRTVRSLEEFNTLLGAI